MRQINQLLLKIVIFTVSESSLKIFIKNNALPGETIDSEYSLDKQAEELFSKSTGISLKDNYLEQLYTVSKSEEIDIVYYVLIAQESIPEVIFDQFVKWDKLAKNTADYESIKYAVQRLRWKIEYTNAVYSLLSREFTFGQFQSVYEAILDEKLDKRNFRKKILSLGILKQTGHIKKMGKARPAEMFAFKKRELTYIEIL